MTGIYQKICTAWDGLPTIAKVIFLSITSILFAGLILRLLLKNKQAHAVILRYADILFKSLQSVRHNYGAYIGEAISAGLILSVGYSLALKIQGQHSWWFWVGTPIAIIVKLRRLVLYSIASGREFTIFYQNRANAAAAVFQHNDKMLPNITAGFDYKSNPTVETFISGILENHLQFLHRTLRLGFSRHGKDTLTVSLLFYDPTKQEWVKWNTFFEPKTNPKHVRKGSTWPKKKEEFRLTEELYTAHKNRPYTGEEIEVEGYKSVLTIPYYFRRNGREGTEKYEQKGLLYGALSYTNTNPRTFNDFSADKFLEFFALEAAVIERMAFRIYKSYNFY